MKLFFSSAVCTFKRCADLSYFVERRFHWNCVHLCIDWVENHVNACEKRECTRILRANWSFVSTKNTKATARKTTLNKRLNDQYGSISNRSLRYNNGEHKQRRRRRQRRRNKTKWFMTKTNDRFPRAFTFWYISLPSAAKQQREVRKCYV